MKDTNLNAFPIFAGLMLILFTAIPAVTIASNTPQKMSPTPNQHNNKLTQLQTLLKEHAGSGAETFIARYDKSTKYLPLQQQINTNTQQLTVFFGNLYGQDKKNQFRDLWMFHNNSLLRYTDAVKSGNKQQKQLSEKALASFVLQISDFFAAQNGSVTKKQMQDIFIVHINDEISIINAHAQNNKVQEPALMQQALNHADMMADLILKSK